jgi:hypothetical protein
MRKAIVLFGGFSLGIACMPVIQASVVRGLSEDLGASLQEIPVHKQGPPDFDREIRRLAEAEKRFQSKNFSWKLDPLRPVLDRMSHEKKRYRREYPKRLVSEEKKSRGKKRIGLHKKG